MDAPDFQKAALAGWMGKRKMNTAAERGTGDCWEILEFNQSEALDSFSRFRLSLPLGLVASAQQPRNNLAAPSVSSLTVLSNGYCGRDGPFFFLRPFSSLFDRVKALPPIIIR
jgi:hypothetical protein